MNERINLRRASTFHAVAKTGGVNAAARALNKSPSAVHHDITQFQKELGCSLFERVGRRLQMTPEGRLMFETVSRALNDISRIRSRLALGGSAVAPLRIAAVSAFGRYRLAPRLLAAAPCDRPIELLFGAHDVVAAAVATGLADYGLSYREVVATPIKATKAAEEELVLLCACDKRAPRGFAALSAAPFITYDEYEYVFARWFAAAYGRQPDSLRVLDHMSEMEEAMESCAVGRGFTIVPADAWRAGSWGERLTVSRRGRARCVNTIYLLSVGAAADREDALLIAKLARRAD